ncbi:MAG: prolyl aminopeptidase [Actinobacteria bacterium]|nr:MAG: prolyl aminopeptidase [Actinomycetota bacterium]
MRPFARADPYDEGMLDVGDRHRVAWSIAGNPNGKAAIVLHGGPGSGCSPGFRRWFDPQRYRVVLMDQRGSGRSTPHAGDPDVDLSTNTTQHLVADIERLREHLAIDRWLVWGGSWGTTLGLAYAETHPDHVAEMILVSVVTTTAAEVEWVTRSMGRVFPAEWARFRDGVPPAERDGNLAAAYARLLQDPDPAVHGPAAVRWCEWEDTHVATHPGHVHDDRYDDPRFRLAFARLVTHYWSNAAFLDDGVLMRDAGRLDRIPGVLVHGRLDISGPPDIAWQLAERWPTAELVLIGDAGHGASDDAVQAAIIAATNRFAG